MPATPVEATIPPPYQETLHLPIPQDEPISPLSDTASLSSMTTSNTQVGRNTTITQSGQQVVMEYHRSTPREGIASGSSTTLNENDTNLIAGSRLRLSISKHERDSFDREVKSRWKDGPFQASLWGKKP